MEASSQSRAGGSLLNNPRVTQYSKDTQDVLRLMMQEAGFTTLQRKQINDCLKNGEALPLTFAPPKPKTVKYVPDIVPSMPQRRTAAACRSGNSYVREKFRPGPTRDLEKEKRRLQSILATGQEEPTAAFVKNVLACPTSGVVEEKDRYQEVLDEIAERRQFLADMASLGQEWKYNTIINIEISQRIRELELLDKACSPKKDAQQKM